jgi:hypothetical protein
MNQRGPGCTSHYKKVLNIVEGLEAELEEYEEALKGWGRTRINTTVRILKSFDNERPLQFYCSSFKAWTE